MDFKKTFDSVRTEVLYNIVIEFGSSVKVISLTKTCLIETCNRFRVGKLLSNTFCIKNGLKQIDALSPLLFTYSLTLRRRIKSHLLFAGIIRSSPFSLR